MKAEVTGTWWGFTIAFALILGFFVVAARSGRLGPAPDSPSWWVLPAIYLSIAVVIALAKYFFG